MVTAYLLFCFLLVRFYKICNYSEKDEKYLVTAIVKNIENIVGVIIILTN